MAYHGSCKACSATDGALFATAYVLTTLGCVFLVFLQHHQMMLPSFVLFMLFSQTTYVLDFRDGAGLDAENVRTFQLLSQFRWWRLPGICWGQFDAVGLAFLDLMGPFILFSQLAAVTLFCRAFCLQRVSGMMTTMKATAVWTYLFMLMGVLLVCLESMDCIEVASHRVLSRYPSISCDSPDAGSLVALASIVFVVFAVVIPCVWFRYVRLAVKQSNAQRLAWMAPWSDYLQPQLWWWPLSYVPLEVLLSVTIFHRVRGDFFIWAAISLSAHVTLTAWLHPFRSLFLNILHIAVFGALMCASVVAGASEFPYSIPVQIFISTIYMPGSLCLLCIVFVRWGHARKTCLCCMCACCKKSNIDSEQHGHVALPDA